MSNFIAIDFETANTDKASACSIGAVQFNKTKISKKFESLIRPPKDIDHLRSDYHFSFTIYKVKSMNYYGITINRRGHNPKNGTLGSPKLIENHLREYNKRRPLKMAELDRIGWDRFIRNEVNDRSG